MALMAHNWVEFTVLPITVSLEGENLVTSTSEEGLEIAEDERQIICWDCKQHLTHDVFESACPNSPTPEQLNTL